MCKIVQNVQKCAKCEHLQNCAKCAKMYKYAILCKNGQMFAKFLLACPKRSQIEDKNENKEDKAQILNEEDTCPRTLSALIADTMIMITGMLLIMGMVMNREDLPSDFVCNDHRQDALQRTAIFAPAHPVMTMRMRMIQKNQMVSTMMKMMMTMTGGLISSRQIGHSSSWHPPAFCTSRAMSKFSTNLAMIVISMMIMRWSQTNQAIKVTCSQQQSF